jgi:hypothetical protein
MARPPRLLRALGGAAERFRLYREATVAAVLRPLQAEISMRTRVLDFLGVGFPSLRPPAAR